MVSQWLQKDRELTCLTALASVSTSHLRQLLPQSEILRAKSLLYTAEAAAQTPNRKIIVYGTKIPSNVKSNRCLRDTCYTWSNFMCRSDISIIFLYLPNIYYSGPVISAFFGPYYPAVPGLVNFFLPFSLIFSSSWFVGVFLLQLQCNVQKCKQGLQKQENTLSQFRCHILLSVQFSSGLSHGVVCSGLVLSLQRYFLFSAVGALDTFIARKQLLEVLSVKC